MIIGIAGYGGSGKSLLAVTIARTLQLKGYKVITNMLHYKYRDYDLVTELPEIIQNVKKDRTLLNEKRIAVVDEVQNILDSRYSMYGENKRLSRILFQLRKLKIDMIYTLQDIYSVDVRLRRITEYYLFPDYNEDTYIMKIEVTDRMGFLLGRKKIKINPAVYELYDTFEFMDIDTTIDVSEIFSNNIKKSNKKAKSFN